MIRPNGEEDKTKGGKRVAEMWIRIRIKLKGRIRIRIKVLSWTRIRIYLQMTSQYVWNMGLFEHFFKVLTLFGS
jgi:hypothetical protein